MISQDPSRIELSIPAESELATFANTVEELYGREEDEPSSEGWLEAALSFPLPQINWGARKLNARTRVPLLCHRFHPNRPKLPDFCIVSEYLPCGLVVRQVIEVYGDYSWELL